MDHNISLRISILRFPLITGIVFIHAAGTTIKFADNTAAVPNVNFLVLWVQCLLSDILASISVPFFFLISGFLYFTNYNFTWKYTQKKLKTRIKTLLIPYLIWNAAALLIYFILQSIPAFSPFFSGHTKNIINYTSYDYLNAFIAFHKSANSPVVYPLWFVRDLLFFVIVAPIFWFMAERAMIAGLTICFVWWLCFNDLIFANISSDGLFFFFLGSLIALRRINLKWIDTFGKQISLIYIFLTAIAGIFLVEHHEYVLRVNKILIIPGILSSWFCAGLLLKKRRIKEFLLRLAGSTFIVFAAHEPFLLGGIRKILYRYIPPSNSCELLSYYFAAPLMTIMILVALNEILISYFPTLHSILTGHRGKY